MYTYFNHHRRFMNGATLTLVVLIGFGICMGQNARELVNKQYGSLVDGYINPVVDYYGADGTLEVSDFVFSFSSSVDFSAVEIFVTMIFGDDFSLMSPESISSDNSQWLLPLYEPITAESWFEFVILQNGRGVELDSLAVDIYRDEITEAKAGIDFMNLSYRDVILNGLIFSVMQINRSLEQSDTIQSSSVITSGDDIQITRRLDKRKSQRSDVRDEQLVDIFSGEATLRNQSGGVAAVCCQSESSCAVLGGDKCPGGFQPASCPCNWSE